MTQAQERRAACIVLRKLIINRVFYDDYMAIFEEDGFQIDRMEIIQRTASRSPRPP